MQSRDDIAEQVVALAGSVSNEKAAKMRALVADARLDGAKSRVDLIEARCHGLIAAHEVALNLSKAISDIQDRDMARIADLERGASILRAEDAGILERLARAETTIKAAWDNDAKGHRWNEERISALEKRLADFERATTNTGEGASTRKGDDGTLTGQPTVSTPSPAPSASEIHAWVPSETELEALWRTHPVGGEFAAMRRLIASRAPRASAVGVEEMAMEMLHALTGSDVYRKQFDLLPDDSTGWTLTKTHLRKMARSALSALSASEIPAWVPSADAMRQACGESAPGEHWNALRRLIASRAPRASTFTKDEEDAAHDNFEAWDALHQMLLADGIEFGEEEGGPMACARNIREGVRRAIEKARSAPRASTVSVEALAHAREALRQLLPCGHDGDEDSGQCDPDCDKCACEGAIAHIDAALSALPASEAPQPRAAQPAPAATPDEGEVYAAFVKLYVAACVAANSDGWDVPQVCHPMWTVLAKAALSLSSSRTPRVDAEFVEVADCLRDRFDLLYRMNGAFNPRDAKETAHDEECLADYDRVREGVECVGEKESAS